MLVHSCQWLLPRVDQRCTSDEQFQAQREHPIPSLKRPTVPEVLFGPSRPHGESHFDQLTKNDFTGENPMFFHPSHIDTSLNFGCALAR